MKAELVPDGVEVEHRCGHTAWWAFRDYPESMSDWMAEILGHSLMVEDCPGCKTGDDERPKMFADPLVGMAALMLD